jgi:hypothetical protein
MLKYVPAELVSVIVAIQYSLPQIHGQGFHPSILSISIDNGYSFI